MGCGRSKLANKSNADAPENEKNDYYKKSDNLGKPFFAFSRFQDI